MNSKLIKLSETHYIVVDDYKIKEGDWMFNYSGVKYNEQVVSQCTKNAAINWQQNIHINNGTKSIRDCIKKITYSTQPLEGDEFTYWFDEVKPLSPSEVEEAINGYSVEKMAQSAFTHPDFGEYKVGSIAYYNGYKDGFNAHKELVKDKFILSKEELTELLVKSITSDIDFIPDRIEQIIQSLLPKRAWDVEFDEQGKLKLI